MRFWGYLLLASIIAVFPAVIWAGGSPQTAGQEKQMTQQQMMDMMKKYGMPGKHHEFLKKYVGEWEIEVRTWEAPGTEPMQSTASAKNELIFDGRYLKSQFEGLMMGMGFKGLQIIGYDLFQNKYVGFWIDSMGTAFYLTTGMLDASGNVLTETGNWADPMTGGNRKVKIVTTFMPDGKYRFEMFMYMPDGKEFKSMELLAKRKM
jgi:hypothetical protein